MAKIARGTTIMTEFQKPVTAESEDGGQTETRRRALLIFLMLAYTLSFLDRQIVSILAEDIKADLALSDFELGMVTGLAFAVFYATLGIPLAWLADRSNRIRIVAGCLLVWSGFTAAGALAGNFMQLALVRLGVGIGEAGCLPASHSLIADSYEPAERSRAMATFQLGVPLGILVGFLFGGWINVHFGWRWALILAALPGFVLAAAMMIVCRDPRPGKSPSTQIDAAIPQRGALADLLEQPGYRYLCVAATLSSMGGYMVLAFLPAYAIRTFDLSTGIVGSALALLLGVGGGLGTYLGGVLGDRTTQRGAASPLLISMAACVISGPMFLLAFYISNLPLLAFMLVVPCVTMTAWMGPNWATVQSLSAIKHRAFASAFILLLINLIGLGAGPTLVGLLSDVFTGLGNANGLRAALSVSMSVFPLAGLFFWLAHRSCARKSASDAAFAVSTE